jgi:hypothetical protein
MEKKPGAVQFGKSSDLIIRDRKSAMDRAKAGGDRPVGGVPPVHIPRLDAQHIDGGGSMDSQSEVLTDPTSPLSPAYSPELAMQKKGQSMGPPPKMHAPLPEEARQDPRFRPGVGSGLSVNQPQMTEGGAYKPPLSDETLKALETFGAQAEAAQKAEFEKNKTTEKVAIEDAGKAVEKQVKSTGSDFADDFREMIGDDYAFDLLKDPERRKRIEARLEPLDIAELIIQGEIRQWIPIIPGKFEVEFRSPSIDEDLCIKRLMFEEKGGERYILDKYVLMNLAVGLVSINGQELPTHLDNAGRFDEIKFLKKFDRVKRLPIQLIADLGIQYLWFDIRVRRLLTDQTEHLKNS